MLLYLVQHAEAKKEEEDPERPLSESGAVAARNVASCISRLNMTVHKVLHSKKLRAKQTAQILAEHLKLSPEIAETDGLAPLDKPEVWLDRLKYMAEDVMLVGHLPHLGKLSSLLLCGDPDKSVISFKMAGVVCLERDEKGQWSVRWMIVPDVIAD